MNQDSSFQDNVGEDLSLPARANATRNISGAPSEGTITQTIGTGENAKNSFVWVTVRWSFIIGGATTLALYIQSFFLPANTGINLIDEIKSTWSIFLPIITLALGYAFGKGE